MITDIIWSVAKFFALPFIAAFAAQYFGGGEPAIAAAFVAVACVQLAVCVYVAIKLGSEYDKVRGGE